MKSGGLLQIFLILTALPLWFDDYFDEYNIADIAIASVIMTSRLPLIWWLQQMVPDTNRAQSPGITIITHSNLFFSNRYEFFFFFFATRDLFEEVTCISLLFV